MRGETVNNNAQIKQIDKMMTLIEKAKPRMHGSALSFSKGDSFVYVSTIMRRISLDGVVLDLDFHEYMEVLNFIVQTHYKGVETCNFS